MRYENDRPIYLQVIEDISRRLIQGELALGEKLPSVREMAVQYQINPNTASRVYKEMGDVLYEARHGHNFYGGFRNY